MSEREGHRAPRFEIVDVALMVGLVVGFSAATVLYVVISIVG